ncbi:hypothetical protein HAX54_033342 [Datura stramonium]|uniref:Uncharacterized protein n=1 Tax=Datura stramonium TaxID=4076 RepID=A0ABS8SDK0_DATST|nr:hypothetical protein [Datura stramonium]
MAPYDGLLMWSILVQSSLTVRLLKKFHAKANIMAAHSAFKEIDYFEAAQALQLTETKEEDYMPKPFVPEVQIVEDAGATTRPAWNSSLTRRNGTRNGGARGRRKKVVDTTPAPVLTTVTSSPLMHQLSNIEASLEDKSLTGWGKTPRRPRDRDALEAILRLSC